MLLISTTHAPATDLGFLLHKNPSRLHEEELSFGKAYVVFPEVSDAKCTAAVFLEVDSIGMVRGKNEFSRWDEYVNDRPYVASSFLSSALTGFFSTAMSGRSKERPELADQAIPLEFNLPVIKCRGGEVFLRSLFEPLGYTVACTKLPLDINFPEWGESSYFSVTLTHSIRLKDALEHLYVLVPVLDDDKHYWVKQDEIDKLMRRGGDWLPRHPARDEIANRYLLRQRNLTREAIARLSEFDNDPDPDLREQIQDQQMEQLEAPFSLHQHRLETVAATIRSLGCARILDLGCGEGRLIRLMIKDPTIAEIVGVDVTYCALEKAKRFLRWDQLPEKLREKVRLVHGSLTYRDRSLEGYDAAAIVEVIEHLDVPRLQSLERTVFEFARPRNVLVTTPNREYNVLFEGMAPHAMRHKDHRFEWTRAEFESWANELAAKHGYRTKFEPVGPIDATYGAPTQMAVFSR